MRVLPVPVGVGSLGAAAARFGAAAGARVVGVEPATAACLTASLAAGVTDRRPHAGHGHGRVDCAEVSPAAWPSLRDGIAGTVLVERRRGARRATQALARAGIDVGECGRRPLAALRGARHRSRGRAAARGGRSSTPRAAWCSWRRADQPELAAER